MVAVLDELIAEARAGTDTAADIPDALEAFRSMFIGSCEPSDADTATILRLATAHPGARPSADRRPRRTVHHAAPQGRSAAF
ncbi:hypothetical protein [Mycobacterium tilburgii]|uniref:hypothetical protein n=1 Tax=Mycobacterium tilburgii TaxID=44467 RepID=UPI001184597D|nr:hypothetical protein [Mycobacterium tilburgii]